VYVGEDLLELRAEDEGRRGAEELLFVPRFLHIEPLLLDVPGKIGQELPGPGGNPSKCPVIILPLYS
jgi:hypothetical protein